MRRASSAPRLPLGASRMNLSTRSDQLHRDPTLARLVRAAASTALAVLAAVGCSSSTRRPPLSREARLTPPSARLDGDQLTVLPSGETFRLPESWVLEYAKTRSNLTLARPQLEEVRHGAGDWDTEFAAVANAVLPFGRCAAHVGAEGFGDLGRFYTDLQARIYVGTSTPAAVHEAVLQKGRATAETFFRPVSSSAGSFGSWTATSLSWDAYYWDYGGRAKMTFYTREHEGWTVVVVFMYTSRDEHEAERNLILNSFD